MSVQRDDTSRPALFEIDQGTKKMSEHHAGPEWEKAASRRPARRFLTVLVCGYSFVFFLTAMVVLVVILVVDQKGGRAQPPQIGWPPLALFAGSTMAFALLQLALLYRVKDRDFWPSGMAQWAKRLVPLFPLIIFPAIPLVLNFPQRNLTLAAAIMFLSTGVGLIPFMLAMSDWLRHRSEAVEEKIRLRRVLPADLPAGVRDYFDARSADLASCGFQPLGDYRLKEQRAQHARFFLHQDGETFAEISDCRIACFPLRGTCFMSLTCDGFYLESSNMRIAPGPKKGRNIELLALPGRSVEEVFQSHRARLREVDRGVPRSLSLDDLEPVIHYGNKRLYEMLCGEGMCARNPYADFDESVLIARTVEEPEPMTIPFENRWRSPATTNSL